MREVSWEGRSAASPDPGRAPGAPSRAPGRRARAALAGLLLALLACSPPSQPAASPTPEARFEGYETNEDWQGEAPLVLRGFEGSAMEPRIAPDSRTLLFNDKPASGDRARQIHQALRDPGDPSGLTWIHQGEVEGVNAPGALDGSPALHVGPDGRGQLWFVSMRAYDGLQHFGSLWGGDLSFREGRWRMDSPPTPRDGAVELEEPGHVDMDVEVTPDGRRLIVSRASFSERGYPDRSRLTFFSLSPDGRALPDPDSDRLLAAVNDPGCRVYAGCLSADGRELYYSAFRFVHGALPMRILVSKRDSPRDPFPKGRVIQAVTGARTEAPSLSSDGRTLYFHKQRPDGSLGLYRVTRR